MAIEIKNWESWDQASLGLRTQKIYAGKGSAKPEHPI